MIGVLFVCLGNICRSPTAEGVVRKRLAEAGLADVVTVDSCGTAGWHAGKAPDGRAQVAAQQRGIDLSGLRARQLSVEDVTRFDYVLAMDHDNLANIKALCPADSRVHVGLLLDFAGYRERVVPDPYYGDDQGFGEVLDLIERAADGLIEHLREHEQKRLERDQ